MYPTLKTSAVLLTLSLALSAGAVTAAAQTPSISPLNNNISPSSASAALQEFSIEVNGSTLADIGFQASGAKEPSVPLRAIAEALGFTLTWNAGTKSVDLSKGNIYTTVKNGEDRYTINKMYTSLGAAPELKLNKLYVPASFVSEVLHQTIAVKGDSIVVTTAGQHLNKTGVITSVNNEGKYQSVQIKGIGPDGIVLNVGEETVLERADGTKLAFPDLHIGMTVEAEHSMITTLSLPPQTPAFKITVLDEKKQSDLLGTAGTLEEVRKGDDGAISVVVKGTSLSDQSQNEVVLRLSADTVLMNGDGQSVNSSVLAKGARVIGFYSPLLTRSLPPIGTAWKLVLEE